MNARRIRLFLNRNKREGGKNGWIADARTVLVEVNGRLHMVREMTNTTVVYHPSPFRGADGWYEPPKPGEELLAYTVVVLRVLRAEEV